MSVCVFFFVWKSMKRRNRSCAYSNWTIYVYKCGGNENHKKPTKASEPNAINTHKEVVFTKWFPFYFNNMPEELDSFTSESEHVSPLNRNTTIFSRLFLIDNFRKNVNLTGLNWTGLDWTGPGQCMLFTVYVVISMIAFFEFCLVHLKWESREKITREIPTNRTGRCSKCYVWILSTLIENIENSMDWLRERMVDRDRANSAWLVEFKTLNCRNQFWQTATEV